VPTRRMYRLRIKSEDQADRIDCRKLARSLRAGEIEGIYVPCRGSWRIGVWYDPSEYGAKADPCKNQIKSLLLFYGLAFPKSGRETLVWPVHQVAGKPPHGEGSGEVALGYIG